MVGSCECGNELLDSIKCGGRGGISCLTEVLLAYQEGLCSMQLVERVAVCSVRHFIVSGRSNFQAEGQERVASTAMADWRAEQNRTEQQVSCSLHPA